MKYEEIKIGESYTVSHEKEKVVAKIDEYKYIITTNENGDLTAWLEEESENFSPIKEELPKEGLLVAENGALVYRTGVTSGYGFEPDEEYRDIICWTFVSNSTYWRKATEQEENKFIEMLKKECEKRGLFEDTKIEKHANVDSLPFSDYMGFDPGEDTTQVWNKNGRIFYKGKFATPRKKEETTLTQVAKAVQEIEDFTIEQTKSGIIILNPIKR